MGNGAPAALAAQGFEGLFRADDDARAVYAEAAGIGRQLPRAIAVPHKAGDVCAIVRWAAASATPLIPRGSGSSMAGAAIGDGVIVDTSRMRAMSEINAAGRSVRVDPGVLCGEVDDAARSHGLRFPVNPSSGGFCTVGGMASTNAAGARSLAYGPMRRWVRALECVFDDGTRAEVRRGSPAPAHVPAVARFLDAARALVDAELRDPSVHPGVLKDASGYGLAAYAESRELVDLLVGSEGTLALITSVELEIAPRPAATSSVLGAFATLEDAVGAATKARAAGAVACELLDKTFLEVAASGGRELPIPSAVEAVLLVEIEGESAAEAERAARRVEGIFARAGATKVQLALDAATETELWELRHAASPILARLDPSLRSMQFIEDGAVPPDRLPEYVRGVRAALARYDTRGVIFGHAGDAHVHVNPLVDVSRHDWRARVNGILSEVTGLVASLGGTVSGEHGDGRLRAPLLPRVWSASALQRFSVVKRCFDPANILNRGVKFAQSAHDVGDVKYDPALPPLPGPAAAALASVERDRAYARFRLDLLDGLSPRSLQP
ncbi:MAG TPA: FAD-binding oxidoreductase [Gemmatimonadaceae bacterium]